MTRIYSKVAQVRGHDFQGNPVEELITTPDQLALFQDANISNASSTIELYDAMPKCFPSNKEMEALRRRNGGHYLETLSRNFLHRGVEYQLIIRPARVRDASGVEREYYPTQREDLIEQALRKLATHERNGIFLGGNLAVQFSLSDLSRELERTGHGMSYRSLKQGLEINNATHISLIGGGQKPVINSTIFPVFIHANRQQWEDSPSTAKCYVKFHPLVTVSVEELTHRQLDYETMMSFRYVLSYWLFKRLSHLYTFADYTKPYSIRLTTIVRDSDMVPSSNPSDNLKRVRRTLDEFVERGVLLCYEEEMTRGPNNRIVDVKFSMVPTPEFKEHAILANQRQQRIRQLAHANLPNCG
ncbi:MAG: hypothetical protein KDB03_22625 [Planctomycetales bacterium]|nr:hypothetical protein [Planctomycetales bacterium]